MDCWSEYDQQCDDRLARDQASFEPGQGEGTEGIQPFITGVFKQGGRVFYEVNLKAILRDERFFDVTQDRRL
ncbi:MAG: hypothetical protein VYE04_18330 [Pseudomonadota bacterium]|nr:hypothetical protein [Pseudomonadota bacterium]